MPFFPHRTPSVTLKPTTARKDADRFTVTIAGTAGPDDPKQDQALAGVLAFDDASPLAWTATLRRTAPVPGSCVLVTLEGTRPMLVEIQALVDSGGPSPRRLSVGLDRDRLAMLLLGQTSIREVILFPLLRPET